ncbi:MAG: DnaB helicase C-terminal domain-containing protein [Clostridium sp.]|nr:DnaB helicase C-terminal domain-containing protein [Clostridium sp.]
MKAIIDNKRLENECELLALILNKNEVIDLLQIKSDYLCDKKNQKILKYAIECYEEKKSVLPIEIANKHSDFDLIYYFELYTDFFWEKNNWRSQLDNSQKLIIEYYKEDYIKFLNEKLKNGKIKYEEFMQKIKELDELQLFDETNELKKQDMIECINEQKARINVTNFNKLNNILKLVQGDFLIIGATTGAGKSGLMLNLMNDLMNTYQCIYFNMEMSKSTIYKRMVSIKAQIKVEDVENPKTDYQKQLIDNAMNEIEKAKLIVEHKASNMNMIKSTIAKMKDLSRHTIIFIDHLGLVKIDGYHSLYEQATEVAKQLRQICLEYDCTIISASQLNRGAYSSDEITLSMLKDSGELENSASKVMLLYKDKEANKDDLVQKMIFDVAKNRDGYTGIINAIYDKEKQIFKEKGDF